jgi:hypothetical protein
MCEQSPSSVPGTLCRVFPENGVQKLVELAVDLEKRVEVAIRVGVVLVARSIVSISKAFSHSEDELDGIQRRVTGMVISFHPTHGIVESSIPTLAFP